MFVFWTHKHDSMCKMLTTSFRLCCRRLMISINEVFRSDKPIPLKICSWGGSSADWVTYPWFSTGINCWLSLIFLPEQLTGNQLCKSAFSTPKLLPSHLPPKRELRPATTSRRPRIGCRLKLIILKTLSQNLKKRQINPNECDICTRNIMADVHWKLRPVDEGPKFDLSPVAVHWGKLYYGHISIFKFNISFSITFQFSLIVQVNQDSHRTLTKCTHDQLTVSRCWHAIFHKSFIFHVTDKLL